jgi:hypothetical protein
MVNHWPHLNYIQENRGKEYSKLFCCKENDFIVDLNCGYAPLYNHVSNFGHYYGNDVNVEFIKELKKLNSSRVMFEVKNDKDVIIDKCDILILLGTVAGEWADKHSHCESQTDIISFKNIIVKFKPRICILESAEMVFSDKISNLIEEVKNEGYNCQKYNFNFEEFYRGNFMKRTVWIFRLK